MASPQAEALNEMFRTVRDGLVDSAPTLEDQRAAIEGMGALTAEPEGVRSDTVNVVGVGGLMVIPEDPVEGFIVQYLHGGGYCMGSVNSHRRMVGHIARSAGVRALLLDYRLAPEHPYPAAVNDSVAAYEWLLSEGYTPERIALAGDSGGGGLAVATMVPARDKGLPRPAAAALLSPWVDMECTGASITTNAESDLVVSHGLLKMLSDYYLNGADPRTPLASPLYADLTGLPPLYIQAGSEELVVDDAIRLSEKAQRDDVSATIDVFPEMQHVFQVSAGAMPEADAAVSRIGAFLRQQFGLSAA